MPWAYFVIWSSDLVEDFYCLEMLLHPTRDYSEKNLAFDCRTGQYHSTVGVREGLEWEDNLILNCFFSAYIKQFLNISVTIERVERIWSLICGPKRWPFFPLRHKPQLPMCRTSQCTGAFTPTWFSSAAVCELGGPWHLVWMLWKITASRGRLAEVACAGLLPCTKAASYGCLRNFVSWLVFPIE